MRAASSCFHPIESAVNKLDIRHAARQAAQSWIRLTRRQLVGDRAACSIRADLGDTRGKPTRIGSCRGDLWTLADGGLRPSQPPFCHVEIAIRPEFKSTWI